MAVGDAREMIAALAEPAVLLVFGGIVTSTSTARLLSELGYPVSGTSYITAFGLAKTTSLPREVIERAARALVGVGLLDVLPDRRRGYDSWRVNEAALAAASERSGPV
jgi:hypothetical protein